MEVGRLANKGRIDGLAVFLRRRARSYEKVEPATICSELKADGEFVVVLVEEGRGLVVHLKKFIIKITN